jgi:hypothetical protein
LRDFFSGALPERPIFSIEAKLCLGKRKKRKEKKRKKKNVEHIWEACLRPISASRRSTLVSTAVTARERTVVTCKLQ